MSKESSRYLPEMLRPQVKGIKLEDTEAVFNSLVNFAKMINGGGKIGRLVEQYKKPEVTLEAGKFFIVPLLGRGEQYFNKGNTSLFYVDGQFSLGLGFRGGKNKQELGLGLVSFLPSSALGNYSREMSKRNIDLPTPSPVIVQLQGNKTYYYPERSMEPPTGFVILQSFRWERLLVELIIDWAVGEQMSWLYLLPGKLNKYVTDFTSYSPLQQRLPLRYDGTAKKCGFKMQPNGLWGLDLRGVSLTG